MQTYWERGGRGWARGTTHDVLPSLHNEHIITAASKQAEHIIGLKPSLAVRGISLGPAGSSFWLYQLLCRTESPGGEKDWTVSPAAPRRQLAKHEMKLNFARDGSIPVASRLIFPAPLTCQPLAFELAPAQADTRTGQPVNIISQVFYE